jgi:hypothetical protein
MSHLAKTVGKFRVSMFLDGWPRTANIEHQHQDVKLCLDVDDLKDLQYAIERLLETARDSP